MRANSIIAGSLLTGAPKSASEPISVRAARRATERIKIAIARAGLEFGEQASNRSKAISKKKGKTGASAATLDRANTPDR